MEKANKDIRERISKAGLRHWQVADALGLCDTSFCRRLRHELSADEKERVVSVIEKLSRR